MGIFSSKVSRAAGSFDEFISNEGPHFSNVARAANDILRSDADLGTHHPRSLGATVNSTRKTLDSIRHFIDSIDVQKAGTTMVGAGIFAACVATQNALNRKRISDAVERIADATEKMASATERIANAQDAGGKGLPIQVLDFANFIAKRTKSNIVLAYHPGNLHHGAIERHLSQSGSRWPFLNPEQCLFATFHDWHQLVSYMIAVRKAVEHRKEHEVVCVIFPSTYTNTIREYCDLPLDVEPQLIRFYGNVHDGMPLTWLPGEMKIGGKRLYESGGVFDLGFISVRESPPTRVYAFVMGSIAGFCLLLSVGAQSANNTGGAMIFALFVLFFSLLALLGDGEKIVERRMRNAEGRRSINSSNDLNSGIGTVCQFKPEAN